ncbi:DUF6320 domain-containing protein [Catalinimonas sp. 4WD22]|uniref:DUF6320 domain-containing protein n=1 Tax=Catalinimonas locisalis TaxID=3133978 RepID=UPI003100F34F
MKEARENGSIRFQKRPERQELQTEINKLDLYQRRKLIWEVFSIILGAGVLSTVVLNIIINGMLSWSWYVVTGAITIFILFSIFSFLKHRPFIKILSIFFTTAACILVLDVLDHQLSWAFSLGLPLLLAVLVVLLAFIITLRQTKEKGFNVVAYIFLAMGILTMAVENIISLYLTNHFRFGWSAIAFFSVLPVAAILLYIHFRLLKGANLQKFFHI